MEARTQIGGSLAPIDTTLEGVAFGTALPTSQEIQAAFAANPNASAALASATSTVLLLGALGGGASADETPGVGTTDCQVNLRILRASSQSSLRIMLLDPVSVGSGFSKLDLTLTLGGGSLVSTSFANVGDALAFFDDSIVDLFPSAVGPYWDLAIFLSVTTDSPANGFFATLAIAAVPEPSVIVLLCIGLFAIRAVSRRQHRETTPDAFASP